MTPADARLLLVVGTRPEAIKMAPILRALRRMGGTETRVVLTGQHSALVDAALATFAIVPDWDLGIMREGQSLTEVATECLREVEKILSEWPPDLLLVQGDTASVFFASLAAFLRRGVPIGHVEAGLRTGDLERPFPEEGFRRLTSVLADLHFCPTEEARSNLLAEGIPPDRIHVTGNPVVDALLEMRARGVPPESPVLRRLLGPEAPPFLLLTAHRRESFGGGLERIFRAVWELVAEEPDLEVLFPVHPNPSVVGAARSILGGNDRIHLVDPLSYPDLVAALAGARGVLTDSGGIQEEAPSFGTPVLVLRDRTERPEGILAGVARLVGTDPERIRSEGRRLLRATPADRRSLRARNPYGDGRAGERIAAIVATFLEARNRSEDAGA